jgi:RimJ/RimL family protein N-acetyltransferase
MQVDTPTLENEFVRLVPLSVKHAPALVAFVDKEMWFGMITPVPTTLEQMISDIKDWISVPQRMSFAVIDPKTEAVLGSTSFYEYVPSQERIEIGSTFYARDVWGGPVNPSCKILMLDYAFEQLHVHRVALRCDARNARSISAIEKLGARPEGTLRGHRIAADGSRGDTMYFSILAPEWPDVKAGLQARLSTFS